jgi:hypothetical protein
MLRYLSIIIDNILLIILLIKEIVSNTLNKIERLS